MIEGIKKHINETLESALTQGFTSTNCGIQGELDNEYSLVRLRGMVEFCLEPELYVYAARYKNNTGNNKEVFSGIFKSNMKELGDNLEIIKFDTRQVYKLVPIPYLTSWAKSGETSSHDICNCDEEFPPLNLRVYKFSQDLSQSRNNLEFHFIFKSIMNFISLGDKGGELQDEFKVNELLEVIGLVEVFTVEFPDSSDASTCADLSCRGNELQINIESSVPYAVEVVGNQFKELLSNQEDELSQVICPNESFELRKIYMIHVLGYKRISNYVPIRSLTLGFDGYLAERILAANNRDFLNKLILRGPCKNLDSLYNTLLNYIANRAFSGNLLVAEYVLLSICARKLSNINVKDEFNINDSTQNLGYIALHISNISNHSNRLVVSNIYKVFNDLMPRLINIDVTISNLNSDNFTPWYDSNSCNFHTGLLQFPNERNLVIIDETNLEEGKLTLKGMENLLNIKSLLSNSIINYKFPAYQVPIRCEANVILLSCGAKSLIGDFILKVPLDDVLQDEFIEYTNEDIISRDLLYQLRLYIALVISCTDTVYCDESVLNHVSHTFAERRQAFSKDGREQIRPDILHSWMALSRSYTLLKGETNLTKQNFDYIMKLETKRMK
ncbi:uncharacterized protein CMU_023920 [Cryptosporidium muris RN66]|uniref:Mini-chromosome maintenance complex-binding protein n=1 Tax=Cryptosporidium muris (strain RN66) TaxID=441375 RepID=B6AC34_CRYMR|nr:uncharacterized protein CMU_023920 [Cryptosporidium muris RN66]EEA05387.1 hypothetical protein, conserved [Cryptosporidium muris RN66]|eukprot:XP_002139736.1 hypothetical protein [Cryptosporidium muris RN66]